MLSGENLPLVGAVHEGRAREAHLYLRHQAGHRVPVRVHVSPIRARDGSVLPTDRANDARRLMQSGGLADNQVVQVRVYADHACAFPPIPSTPPNPRISVIVQYLEKTKPGPDAAPPPDASKPEAAPKKE